VFEMADQLMPRQLDADAGALLAALVEELGIAVVTGARIQGLLGGERVEGLTLADGRRFEADLVVVSTGIAPNIDWARRDGIACGRGILVDDRMQTSVADVYAAGDVVEWRGHVVGLWANAIEQAEVATANAVGRAAEFSGFVPVTILKCLGLPVFSVGQILADGPEVTSQRALDAVAHRYRRVIFRAGLPVGGILLNTTDGMGEMKKLVEGGAQVERLSRAVLAANLVAAGA
jgi:nitrite reductase (NADH) large subunit